MSKKIFSLIPFIFILILPQITLPQSLPLNDYITRLNLLNKEVQGLTTDDIVVIQSITKELNEIRNKSGECVQLKQLELEKINEFINSLGEPVEGEPPELVRQRKLTQEQKVNAEKDLNTCKYLLNESSNIIEKITTYQKELVKKQFFYKNYDLFEKIINFYSYRDNFLKDLGDFKDKFRISNLDNRHITILIILLFLGLFISHWFVSLISQKMADEKYRKAIKGISPILYILFPLFLSIIFFLVFLQKKIIENPLFLFLCIFSFSLSIYTVIKILILFKYIKNIYEDNLFNKINNCIKFIIFIGFFIIFFNINYISVLFPLYISDLLKSLSLIIFIFSLLYFLIKYYNKLVNKTLSFISKLISFPLLIIVLISDIIGYNNFSIFVTFIYIKTSFFILLFFIIYKLIKGFFSEIASGEKDWQIKIRDILAIKKGEYFSFLIWIEFLFVTITIIVLLYIYTYILEISKTVKIQINEFLINGFTFAKIQISPLKIIMGVFLLLFLIGLVRWLKRNIEISLNKNANIERSEIDSIVTIFSYVGYVLAFFIFLASSGFNISNLAIIGGALSVGIGFGLQNIVNNFVSGLILLFERPIKKGDWIVVKGTEGYVKRISVRSTIIETFDRCDVIVPNSEIISGQVQNWMFEDRIGRVRVSIGVAYGSNVELVRDILLDIANKHPLTVKDGSVPLPIVWFTDFGESSLNFMLLFYIRDIDRRLRTASEIRFEIYRVFKENNITIPFPQRDVHIFHHGAPQKEEFLC